MARCVINVAHVTARPPLPCRGARGTGQGHGAGRVGSTEFTRPRCRCCRADVAIAPVSSLGNPAAGSPRFALRSRLGFPATKWTSILMQSATWQCSIGPASLDAAAPREILHDLAPLFFLCHISPRLRRSLPSQCAAGDTAHRTGNGGGDAGRKPRVLCVCCPCWCLPWLWCCPAVLLLRRTVRWDVSALRALVLHAALKVAGGRRSSSRGGVRSPPSPPGAVPAACGDSEALCHDGRGGGAITHRPENR